MQAAAVSILIADDHPVVRAGLRDILGQERSFEVIAEYSDGAAALEGIRTLRPDVAILDIEMPRLSGIDVSAVVHRDHIETAVIILTICDSVGMFNRAMDYGVMGYVLKEAAATDLVQSIRRVLEGEYYFSAEIASKAILERKAVNRLIDGTRSLDTLTPTERKILHFISDNMSTVEIADILNISIRTVDTHRAHISRKLDLHGPYALVRFALQHREEI